MPGRRRRSRTVTLRDGTSVRLRPIAPEDKPLLVDVFERLSEDSRYRRFFTSLRELSPATLAYFTEVDHSDREAIIAIEPTSGQALGVARYVRLSEDPEAAEVAVAVVDDWHGRGLAAALLAELGRRARLEGVRRLTALVQADNRASVTVLEGVGDSVLRLVGTNFELVIELGPGRVRS
jgi:RimJ/RimL family protein N-acetyltransferase